MRSESHVCEAMDNFSEPDDWHGGGGFCRFFGVDRNRAYYFGQSTLLHCGTVVQFLDNLPGNIR